MNNSTSNFDRLVKKVKDNKKTLVKIILIGFVAYILFCFFCICVQAQTEIGKAETKIPSVYFQNGKFYKHDSPADIVIDEAPKDWDISLEEQKELISGEKKVIENRNFYKGVYYSFMEIYISNEKNRYFKKRNNFGGRSF